MVGTLRSSVWLVFLASVVVPLLCATSARGDMDRRTWFDRKPCTKLTIEKHRSLAKHEVVRTVVIDDAAYLARLVAELEKLPTDGKMMIKMGGDSSYTRLTFDCGGAEPRVHEIYNDMIKTPGTGFDSPTGELEARIVADVGALLAPALGKVVPKVKGLELRFGSFSLTYLGTSEYDGAPATVQHSVDKFSLVVRGKARPLDVTSGQMAPAPLPFKVGASKRTLVTFETRKGQRLFPTHFQITK